MSVLEFWEITPYELNIASKSYTKKEEIRFKENTYQSYLISRWVWQKKVDIEKIIKSKQKKEVMTDEQMLAKVKALNILFGGEVKVVGKE